MKQPTGEQVMKGEGRLSFQEAMSLVPLPDRTGEDGKIIRRYMGRRSAWSPGEDVIALAVAQGASEYKSMGAGAYGGHVYSQAGLAASLFVKAANTQKPAVAAGGRSQRPLGIHTINGFFTEAGHTDRPFIYEATSLASNAQFPSVLVTARQPTSASTAPDGDHYPVTDAYLPLGPVCFTAMVSFRPGGGATQLDAQEVSPWERFSSILTSRPRPEDWNPAPIVDIAPTLDLIPNARSAVSLFPGLEMRKVDMRAYNIDKPVHESRELILYRLLAPLPAAADGNEVAGPDVHIAAHAYAADRNGVLMVADHAGFGRDLARAMTLSYSFVVHVNPEDTVMAHGNEGDQWWLQETCFPRIHAGRGIVHSKIWSPQGVHVATEYQDGIVRRKARPSDQEKGKL